MSLPPLDTIPVAAQEALFAAARSADEQGVWPEASWSIARQIGAPRWSLPKKFGGEELSGAELLSRYEELAGICLTTCFVLSQRDAACRRLLSHGSEEICAKLLPGLASGERFATVGLAQLTTSRQHVKPVVLAQQHGDEWVLEGTIPWVTGAARAEHIVVGAVTAERQQILAVLPTNLAGVSVGAPLELAALQGSITAEVRLDGVRLPKRWLLAGPAEQVMRGERGGTGGLETSCLALGLAGAVVRHVEEEAAKRPELASTAHNVRRTHRKMRHELYDLADSKPTPEAAQALRARANAHVLRMTQSALAISKGTGFLRDHPAQRWARQALFFLVWSCPWPVTEATMANLNAGLECDG